ncbi:MAG: phosphatidylethanolamine N-methyltransferase family protein [Elusimicrobia bacterium]|nr:phosphatidylethanolamine N-methyltransferase family protein [Candidatus Liberimonas magnetica]
MNSKNAIKRENRIQYYFTNLFKETNIFIELVASISGFVIKHTTQPRIIALLLSFIFFIYLVNYQPYNYTLAIFYFVMIEVFYICFITLVLSEDGYRHWFIKKWGSENEGYLAYEATLGFIFFHNAVSIGYIISSTAGSLPDFIHKGFLYILLVIVCIFGFTMKLWAARVVSIDIYYWKDMFLGKKIAGFVKTGPYKYFKNPMYGVGQFQAYALAALCGSKYGLIAVLINQLIVFTFFYLVEKKFIRRVYQNAISQPVTN